MKISIYCISISTIKIIILKIGRYKMTIIQTIVQTSKAIWQRKNITALSTQPVA